MKKRILHVVRIYVDQPKAQHCWEVKIVRQTSNSFHRSFSDSKFGGSEGALAAALKCRDAELKKRPPMNSYEQVIKPKENESVRHRWGSLRLQIVKRGLKIWEYPAWVATGTPAQRKAWEQSLKESVETHLAK